MTNIVKFQDKELHTHDFNGLPGLSSVELANGLGYADDGAVTRIYNRHSDEFTSDMVQVVKLTTRGLDRQIRVFSPRGCHLVAMFAHTPFAKAFRKWVLDVLDKKPIASVQSLTSDRDALKAIGGIVKNCAAVAVREELAKAYDYDDALNNPQNIMQQLNAWFQYHHSKLIGDYEKLNYDYQILKLKLENIQKAIDA